MRRTIIVILLLCLIALGLLYCAHLDGLVHIEAMAAKPCKLCELLETYDLEAEKNSFVPTIVSAAKSIDYELVLNAHLTHGHDRVARHVLAYGLPFNFCPECGKKISGVAAWSDTDWGNWELFQTMRFLR